MTMANGSEPIQSPFPPHQLPEQFEDMMMATSGIKVGQLGIVSLFIQKPGCTFSCILRAEDAIKWGEQLTQQGRNAKSGLITP